MTKSPEYTFTQDATPGMLIEIEGERFAVIAVTVEYPVVRYTTPRGTESVEYGVAARIVARNAVEIPETVVEIDATPELPAVTQQRTSSINLDAPNEFGEYQDLDNPNVTWSVEHNDSEREPDVCIECELPITDDDYMGAGNCQDYAHTACVNFAPAPTCSHGNPIGDCPMESEHIETICRYCGEFFWTGIPDECSANGTHVDTMPPLREPRVSITNVTTARVAVTVPALARDITFAMQDEITADLAAIIPGKWELIQISGYWIIRFNDCPVSGGRGRHGVDLPARRSLTRAITDAIEVAKAYAREDDAST